MSCPATVTVPAVGGTTPASTRMVVDLPAPVRPSNGVAWPAYAWTSMPATASTSPKRTCRLRTSTTGSLTRASLSAVLPFRPGNVEKGAPDGEREIVALGGGDPTGFVVGQE